MLSLPLRGPAAAAVLSLGEEEYKENRLVSKLYGWAELLLDSPSRLFLRLRVAGLAVVVVTEERAPRQSNGCFCDMADDRSL